jgi:hypothetical protein
MEILLLYVPSLPSELETTRTTIDQHVAADDAYADTIR